MTLSLVIISFIVLVFLFSIFYVRPKENFSYDITRNISSFFRAFAAFYIVIGHISQRIESKSIINLFFIQYSHLMVGVFFLLSGYGNRLSIEKENNPSLKWILKRLFLLWFYFIIGYI